MLHAAATVAALCALWLLWTLQPLTWDHAATGMIAALLSVAFGLRAAPATMAFTAAPRSVGAWLSKLGGATSGVLALARLALFGEGQAALVRLKRRTGDGAMLAMHLGALPGIVHVESDEESLLFHVTDEDIHEPLVIGQGGAPS